MRRRLIQLALGPLLVLMNGLAASAQPHPQVTRPPSKTPAAKPTPIRENPKDGLKYVRIPPGSFRMGCSPGDSECFDEEKPPHPVRISKGFWIGQTEVTVGAFKRFAHSAGKTMPAEPDLMGGALNTGWNNEATPMVKVSWDDAHAYCGWMGGRLPTEAEWEYAARGGGTEARYGPIDEIAWDADNSGRQRLDSTRGVTEDANNYPQRFRDNGNRMHEVGQKRPNGFGLFDTLGNAWEWTNDWYDADYYRNSPTLDPPGPSSGQYRVLRGGSWLDPPWNSRVSYRGASQPDFGYVIHGFRCVWGAR
jgi:formylglycine-generating enzyme required for sulfatase activity